MHTIPSSLVLQILSLHTASLRKKEAQQGEDYKRYEQLVDFLDLEEVRQEPLEGEQSKRAAEGDDLKEEQERSERQKKKELRGSKGLSQAFGRMFRDHLEDYLPGGYFTWQDYARDVSNDFYSMAYKFLKERIPQIIAQSVKPKISDISSADIDLTPEAINQVITDAALYFFKENPDEIKDILVRSFSKKERAEDEERGIGVAQAWFVPRIDEGTFKEMLKDAEKADEDVEAKVGDIDTSVLENLGGRDTVKWKLKSIDENGIVHFTLPELYGKREFNVKLPADIENIRPGEYSFDIKRVGKRGALIEFSDQKKDIRSRTLEEIENTGLGKDQLRDFINKLLNRYNNVLRTMPPEKLAEMLVGQVSIRDKTIGSVEDFQELVGTASGQEDKKQLRGKEKIEQKRTEKEQEIRDMTRSVINRWGPTIAKYFLSLPEKQGQEIVQAISSQYPQKSEKAAPSLPSVLETRPVMDIILETIISPKTPLGGKKSDPWITISMDKIKRSVSQNPDIRDQFLNLMENDQKKKKAPTDLPLNAEGLQTYLNSIPESRWRKEFLVIKNRLKDTILKMKDHPALKNFFDRRSQFKKYISKDLNDAVKEYIIENKINPREDKGRKAIDKYIQKYINRTVSQMTQKFSSETINIMFDRILKKVSIA